MAALLPLAWILLRLRRRRADDRLVLGVDLISAGAIRFAIEWLRITPVVALGMSVAPWASLGTVALGMAAAVSARASQVAGMLRR